MVFISFVGKYNKNLGSNIGAPKMQNNSGAIKLFNFSNIAIAILVFSISLFFALKNESNKFSFTFLPKIFSEGLYRSPSLLCNSKNQS